MRGLTGLWRAAWGCVALTMITSCGEGTTEYVDAPVVKLRLVATMDPVRPLRAQSIAAAVAEINNEGGLIAGDGRRIELAAEIFVQDSDPTENARNTQILALQHNHVFGVITSGSTHTAAVLDSSLPMAVMSGSATSDQFTDLNALRRSQGQALWFSRLAPPDRHQVSVLSAASAGAGVHRLAILEEDGDAYSANIATRMADAFSIADRTRCNALNNEDPDEDLPTCSEVVLRVPLKEANALTIEEQLSPLLETQADGILLAISNVDLLLEALRAIDTTPLLGKANVRLLLVDASLSNALLQAAPFWVTEPTAGGNSRVIGTTPQPNVASENYQHFVEVLRKQGRVDGAIQRFTANYVDVVYVMALAAQAALRDGFDPSDMTTFRQAVRDRIQGVSVAGDRVQFANGWEQMRERARVGDVDYSGASGNCDIDNDGDVTSDYEIWTLVRDADPEATDLLVQTLSTLSPQP